MTRLVGVLLLLIVVPQVATAQEAPEELLPAGTQVYLRWDGLEAHRKAFEKTALGKMMQGDTGKFVNNVVTQLQDTLGALLTVEQLLQGISPAKLLKLQGNATQAPKIVGMLTKNGMIIGMEVRKLEPPEAQFTLILPQGGEQPAPLFSTLQLIAGLLKLEIKEEKIDTQTVQHMDLDGAHLCAWVAGKHLVLVVGTDPPQEAVKRLTAKTPRLTSNPLFSKVQSFNQFETSARAFVDVVALVKIARTRGKEVGRLLEDLGLDGLQSAVLYSGFDGDAERGLIEMEMTGPRKGMFRVVNGKPFKLSDLPPLPHDVTSWSMTNFDMGILYELGLQTAENAFKLIAPEEADKVKEFDKLADNFLGVDLRKDLLGALDDKVAIYSSP